MSADPDTIIQNAIAIANSEKAAADAAAASAIAASSGYASLTPEALAFNINAIEPSVPSITNGTQTYEAQLEKLIDLLSSQLAGFFTQYYPLAADAFDEATNYLLNSITNGGTGISPSIEAQIFGRGKDRIIADGLRVDQQIANDFAGRGFSMPPGAMAAALQESKYKQHAAVGAMARDAAIRQAEIEIDNIRFAVQLAINSRQMAMQAAADYIRAIMSSPDSAAKVAMLNSDVQAKMISATADLYRTRLARDELILRAKEISINSKLKAGSVNVDAYYKGVDARVNAAIAAAGVYGQAAGAALSSLNSVVSSSVVKNN